MDGKLKIHCCAYAKVMLYYIHSEMYVSLTVSKTSSMARNTKQQAQETRNHIIDAAIERFSEHGVASTSLADIAATAGVTRGAIYWHFKNKADLLNGIWQQFDSSMTELQDEYHAKYPSDPLSVLRELVLYVISATVIDPRRRALMEIIYHKCEFVGEMTSLRLLQQALYLEHNEKIEDVLRQCIAAGQLPASLNLPLAAVAMRGYITGIIENWLFMPENFDLLAMAPQLVATLINMLENSQSLRLSG